MTPEPQAKDFHDELMAVLKRRGFIQPSYEIYGGVAGFFDYGPLGAGLKRNLQDLWRRFYVVSEGMAEIECPNVSPEQVFRASGHLEKFADTVIDCPACGAGSRGDHLVKGEWKRIADAVRVVLAKQKHDLPHDMAERIEAVRASADKDPAPANLRALLTGAHDLTRTPMTRDVVGFHLAMDARGVVVKQGDKVVAEAYVQCPACNKPLDASKAKIDAFNLMFKTQVGPGTGRVAYLRPETAQGMFMDFPWLLRYFRDSLPFGAVQIGRAYRNEISPRQSLLRLREFSQMEAEVFFDPEAKTWNGALKWREKTLTLLPRDSGDKTVDMTAGQAVDKGVVANGALGYFLALTQEFLLAAGLKRDRLRFRQHETTEKAHYATDTWDAEFWSPRFGWVEIVGIADRTDYDLTQHTRVSGQRLVARRRLAEPREVAFREYAPDFKKFGPLYKAKGQAIGEALKATPVAGDGKAAVTVHVDGEAITVPPELFTVREGTRRDEFEEFVPHVVEPSYGVDRCFYAILESAWHEGEGKDAWVSLRLPAAVAPVKVGIYPLMPKDGLDAKAQEIDRALRAAGLVTTYDDSGSIGKRYARADEAGVPFGVTVDYDTLGDGSVTVRDRDTAAQVRIPGANLAGVLADLLAGKAKVADLAAGGHAVKG